MKDSLHDYMKVGIVHFMAYPFALSGEEPVADSIAEIVEDDFFDAIEVTRINDDAERRRVADILATSGATVGFGGQPGYGPQNGGMQPGYGGQPGGGV